MSSQSTPPQDSVPGSAGTIASDMAIAPSNVMSSRSKSETLAQILQAIQNQTRAQTEAHNQIILIIQAQIQELQSLTQEIRTRRRCCFFI